MRKRFNGSFTQQDKIPDEGIEAVTAVLQHGRLHRYNVTDGEWGETALFEQEFAHMIGSRYAVAVASGGYALATALRALDVGHGDKVLTNTFTLAPVPGAIASVGAQPIFVEVTEGLKIDLNDLQSKIDKANVLLLSHMRGHICDMDQLMGLCDAAGVRVIEDCAHTLGARWRTVPSGRHGEIGCYSFQTYKHMNSGEGGLLITDNSQIAARTIILSGSYMHYEKHHAAPPPEAFAELKYTTPNVSGRMDNVRAAILRPQLRTLPRRVRHWNDRYSRLVSGLSDLPGLTLVRRSDDEQFVGSSLQFLLLDWPKPNVLEVVDRCRERGVELKWFGADEPAGFTSKYDSWRFAPSEPMPRSDRVLAGLLDMRIPLTFDLADCDLIAEIIRDEVSEVYASLTKARL
ncbi:MAG: aminotransferase class I/II-fold pyridoxal phosphate-dependent enzyme [Aestuariivita sp.]|nr:aminotransferase class I/II-fold pyridoxal phosphate-dependent enzyme [Aestuariivita sp.]